MEILRYSSNAWGQTVPEGVSWDLISVFFSAGLVFIILHALFMKLFSREKTTQTALNDSVTSAQLENGQRIVRHTLTSRLFHWLSACLILLLIFTAFLPILGLKFPWVTTHWGSGIVLTCVISIHIFRSLFCQNYLSMWFGPRDIKESITTLGGLVKSEHRIAIKSGKYSPAQKLMHHSVSLFVLIAIITGLLMMIKIDTPFWDRDPYWLSDDKWGIIYILHGSSSLFLSTIIMIHVYIALRPEKRMYTRSMILGWISKAEFNEYHDKERWHK